MRRLEGRGYVYGKELTIYKNLEKIMVKDIKTEKRQLFFF